MKLDRTLLSTFISALIGMCIIGCHTTRPAVQLHQSNQATKNDLSDINLHGPVKSVEALTYKARKNSAGKITKGRLIGSWITSFNEDGNKRSEVFYNADGTKNLDYHYRYGEAGHLVEEKKKQVGKGYRAHHTFKYDKKGRLTMQKSLYPDTSRTAFTYKNNGRRVVQQSYDSDGKLYSKVIERYKNGHQTEVKSYSFIAKQLILNNHVVYQYDEQGNRIKEERMTPEGKIDGTLSYTYDAHRNVIKEIYRGAGDRDLKKIRYQYRYDAHQNWVRKITRVNGSPDTITIQKIAYDE